MYSRKYGTLRLLLLAGTNFSASVVCCIWQVLILAFLKRLVVFFLLITKNRTAKKF